MFAIGRKMANGSWEFLCKDTQSWTESQNEDDHYYVGDDPDFTYELIETWNAHMVDINQADGTVKIVPEEEWW